MTGFESKIQVSRSETAKACSADWREAGQGLRDQADLGNGSRDGCWQMIDAVLAIGIERLLPGEPLENEFPRGSVTE